MLDTLKELLTHPYEASLGTLNLCVARCPERSWDGNVAKWKFCQVAFHVVMFADLYLQPSDDIEAFKGQAFHVAHKTDFCDYEELEDRPQVSLYEKPFVLGYLQHVRGKAQETIARETAECWPGRQDSIGASARARSCTCTTSATSSTMPPSSASACG